MINGGCLCGSVRYVSSGPPLFSVICHCRDCQKASGTGGVPVMGVRKSSFQVTGAVRQSTTTGGSGKPAIRNFCPECGSLLFGTPESAGDLVTIYVGSLDDPSVFQPNKAVFKRDRPPWAKLATELKEYEAGSR